MPRRVNYLRVCPTNDRLPRNSTAEIKRIYSMKISNGTVACFHFALCDNNGDVFERSEADKPRAYLHGAGNLMPALERRLTGLSAGDRVDVELDALDAFGPRKESLVRRAAIKHLATARRKLKPGDRVPLDDDQGRQWVTIIKMGKYQATVDANHPLAGQSVRFVIEIVGVREATAEETAHGHAHGVDGHETH